MQKTPKRKYIVTCGDAAGMHTMERWPDLPWQTFEQALEYARELRQIEGLKPAIWGHVEGAPTQAVHCVWFWSTDK